MTVQLPQMNAEQVASWHALMDLHERLPPDTWTLIGGQLVHLHCAERGADPRRATDDVDALLDVKAGPTILYDFTRGLKELDFASAGVTPEGHQQGRHRDDFAVLATLVTATDLRDASLTKAERKHLAPMIDAVRADARSLEIVPEAAMALDRLEQITR